MPWFFRRRPHAVLLAAAVASLPLVAASTACRPTDPAPAGAPTTHARVVSLTPSATEVVHAVGAGNLLVGVDQYSTYPPGVGSLPRVGDFLSPNLEAIVALHPDIVFLDRAQTRVISSISSARIRVVPLALQTIADIREGLLVTGAAVGRRAEAGRALAALDASLAASAQRARRAADGARPPRVLFVVDRRPGGLGGMVAAGPGAYLDELLARAGGVNVLADATSAYVPIAVEEVVRRAPDVILDAIHTDDAARARDDWDVLDTVPAVRGRRVHVLDDPLFVTPGPRVHLVLARLVDLLWPPG